MKTSTQLLSVRLKDYSCDCKSSQLACPLHLKLSKAETSLTHLSYTLVHDVYCEIYWALKWYILNQCIIDSLVIKINGSSYLHVLPNKSKNNDTIGFLLSSIHFSVQLRSIDLVRWLIRYISIF